MFIWKKNNQDNKPGEEDNEKIFKELISTNPKDPTETATGVQKQSEPAQSEAAVPSAESGKKDESSAGNPEADKKSEVKAEDFFAISETKESDNEETGKENSNKTSESTGQKESKPLLDKIISLTQKPKTLAPVLGKAPVVLKTLGIKEYRERKQLKILRISLLCSAFIFFSIFIYFFVRLDPRATWFGPNVTTTLENSIDEIKNIQTDINKVNFLNARLELDIFNVISDKYTYLLSEVDSAFIDSEEKRVTEIELSDTEKKLISILKSIKDVLAEKIWIATALEREVESNIDLEKEYRTRFIDALNNQKAILMADPDANISEIKIIDNTVQLANNKNFITEFLAFDFDNITTSVISNVIDLINENTVSDLSIVTKIKNNRINFSDVIANIDKITKKVDVTYGRDLFDELGGIRYDSYNFDIKSNKLTLSGETKTDDGKNFTLIANLLDSMEQSPNFKNVEDSSFSKNLEETEGKYGASFSIIMEIQAEDEEDPRDVLFFEEDSSEGITRAEESPTNEETNTTIDETPDETPEETVQPEDLTT